MKVWKCAPGNMNFSRFSRPRRSEVAENEMNVFSSTKDDLNSLEPIQNEEGDWTKQRRGDW